MNKKERWIVAIIELIIGLGGLLLIIFYSHPYVGIGVILMCWSNQIAVKREIEKSEKFTLGRMK